MDHARRGVDSEQRLVVTVTVEDSKLDIFKSTRSRPITAQNLPKPISVSRKRITPLRVRSVDYAAGIAVHVPTKPGPMIVSSETNESSMNDWVDRMPVGAVV